MKRFEKLRALPCCQCQAPAPSQVAHANWGEFGKGMGKKADDEYTIGNYASVEVFKKMTNADKINQELGEVLVVCLFSVVYFVAKILL